jgi:hypothetical protein
VEHDPAYTVLTARLGKFPSERRGILSYAPDACRKKENNRN